MDLNEEGKLRMVRPSPKVDALIELLEDMNGEPLIVFAASRQLIELASETLWEHDVVHNKIVGGMSDAARGAAELDFQEGRVRAILMTYGAGSESITLTRADTICRMQRSWAHRENLQAIDRFHRPGQESDKCLIVDFVTPGTVEDDQQMASLEEKAERMEEIVRDRRALLRKSR
jgi:SNF2 family DNA or RNA helicase